MDVRTQDLTPSGRVRASSDPLSRGGAFEGPNQRLDQEPNPFEQSFSSGPVPTLTHPDVPALPRRARSNSPVTTPRSLIPPPQAVPTSHPQGGTNGNQNNKLAATAGVTPSGDLSQGQWQDSLRTGPLSPSLLNGPVNGSNGATFESSLLRSGLTPLPNGQNNMSFPPPSPATAALFAMMTNNTPGTSDANGGTTRPTESNQFDASFAQASQGVKPEDRTAQLQAYGGQHVQSAPAPLSALHRAAMSQAGGARGGTATQGAQPHPYSIPPRAPYPMNMQQQGGQNPLYLLSQAQDLSNVQDDAVVAAAALSNLGGPLGGPGSSARAESSNGGSQFGGSNFGGSNFGDSPKSSTSPSKPRRAAAASKRKQEADDDYEASMQPASKKGPGKRGRKKKDEDEENAAGETEDEKRKNFLERNRQAALKCRQRKKAWLTQLQAKVEFLTADNDTLQQTVTNLKDEIASLRAILAAHATCPVALNNDRRAGLPAGQNSNYANGQAQAASSRY